MTKKEKKYYQIAFYNIIAGLIIWTIKEVLSQWLN